MARLDLICNRCNNITKDVIISGSRIVDSMVEGWVCEWCGAKKKTMTYWGLGDTPHVKTQTYIGDLWDKKKTLTPGDKGYNEAVLEDIKNKKIDGGKRKRK